MSLVGTLPGSFIHRVARAVVSIGQLLLCLRLMLIQEKPTVVHRGRLTTHAPSQLLISQFTHRHFLSEMLLKSLSISPFSFFIFFFSLSPLNSIFLDFYFFTSPSLSCHDTFLNKDNSPNNVILFKLNPRDDRLRNMDSS